MEFDKNTKELAEKYDLSTYHEIITDIQPKGYNISSASVTIGELSNMVDKTTVTVYGYIDSFELKSFGSKLKRIKAKLYNNGESTTLFWITSNRAANTTKYALEMQTPKNTLIQVTGKIDSFKPDETQRIIQISSPKLNAVTINPGNNQNNANYIVPEPNYVLKNKTTITKIQHAFRVILKNLEQIIDKDKNFIPSEIAKELELKSLKNTLTYIHGFKPIERSKLESFLTYPEFKKRLNLEKIWRILKKNSEQHNDKDIPSIKLLDTDKETLKELQKKLPFELTNDQKKSVWGMLLNFSKKTGTSNLLFGDVGSGKTLVALFVAEVLRRKGYQVLFMAPTSILAKQHFEEAVELLGKNNVEMAISKTTVVKRRKLNERLRNREPLIVIGTTTLNNLEFSNVKAIFIDEEQKVGVAAKEKIYNKFNKEPHVILMTATPVPRTLASAIFTNYSIFQIREKPKGRLPRKTEIFYYTNNSYTSEVMSAVGSRMRENKEQTLVIVPSITGNEMASVEGVIKKFKQYYPDLEIRSIHGKMNKKEAEKNIEEYMKNKYPILIATSMVDSGFSNKRISHVFIEGAERFGIAQLHQMRGRCGRGTLQGYCYLCPGNKNLKDHTLKRLKSITESEDGFWLSERDIELRGSGDLDGIQQSGMDLNFVEYKKEIEVMKKYL